MTQNIEVRELAERVAGGERGALAKAITLVESSRTGDRDFADAVLTALAGRSPATPAWRVAITGSPGVGKSTFIDALGMELIGAGHKVAVMAIDPSSSISGGSILGDKSRMVRLVADENAFVRPTPSGGALGGLGPCTRDTVALCELAGYDVVLIETVGVGQSETDAAQLADTFVLLVLPGSGDELQGIKRGIVELADIVAVNKADGDRVRLAESSRADYRAALTYLAPRTPGWKPAALTVSSTEDRGVAELWQKVAEHRGILEDTGELVRRRRAQRRFWLDAELNAELVRRFRDTVSDEAVDGVESRVEQGSLTPRQGARELFQAFVAAVTSDG